MQSSGSFNGTAYLENEQPIHAGIFTAGEKRRIRAWPTATPFHPESGQSYSPAGDVRNSSLRFSVKNLHPKGSYFPRKKLLPPLPSSHPKPCFGATGATRSPIRKIRIGGNQLPEATKRSICSSKLFCSWKKHYWLS